jgi:uncharacterized beta-barrel protein YwiB (DUF1934 family)
MKKPGPDMPPVPRETAVTVSVTGTDAEGAQIVLRTGGTLTDLPEGWMLSYEETSPDSLHTSQTMVQYGDGRITVLRAGDIVSVIAYAPGETFLGKYETPLGIFTLRVFATEVTVKRRGDMGHSRLAYQISLMSELSPTGEMAMRRLDIRFRPCAG